MGVPHFPSPAGIPEPIELLNATHLWHIQLHVRGATFAMVDGDQPVFTATTKEEAQAFVAGCFLATFLGKDLKQITQELADGRYADLYAGDALAEIERDRSRYAQRRDGRNREADTGTPSDSCPSDG